MDILVLCTANQCRSPMAEALLAARLEALGVPAVVHSAGELAGGAPASAGSVRAMKRRGLDLSAHRSSTVTASMLEAADLVLAMSKRHLRSAVVEVPSCFGRAFTIKELVRRGSELGPRQPDEELADWLARLHDGRAVRSLLGDDPHDDVDDPMGMPDRAYEATAIELEELFDRFVNLAFAGAERRESA